MISLYHYRLDSGYFSCSLHELITLFQIIKKKKNCVRQNTQQTQPPPFTARAQTDHRVAGGSGLRFGSRRREDVRPLATTRSYNCISGGQGAAALLSKPSPRVSEVQILGSLTTITHGASGKQQ